MKAPTWVALALCIGRALPSKTVSGDHIDQCEVVCHAIKSEISSAEACTKARKSLPRPKIGRVCQVGRVLGGLVFGGWVIFDGSRAGTTSSRRTAVPQKN